MEIILPKNHILYTSANEIKEICVPLKNNFDISFFSFVKINPDLSRLHLGTHIEWNKHFYKNAHRYYRNHLTEGKHWQSGFSVIHMLADHECIRDARNFNIGDGIVIANHINRCTELAFILLSCSTSDSDSKVTQLLNNTDILQKFLFFFKSKMAEIFKDESESTIKMPFLKDGQLNSFSIDVNSRKNFLEDINTNNKNKDSLTNREIECIEWLSRDMSVKEIARILAVSPRTIKQHLANARAKVGCKKSATLIGYPHKGEETGQK